MHRESITNHNIGTGNIIIILCRSESYIIILYLRENDDNRATEVVLFFYTILYLIIR